MQDLSTVFAFADITMTCLAFVNLVALALLFKVGLRVMRDYDEQRRPASSSRCSTPASSRPGPGPQGLADRGRQPPARPQRTARHPCSATLTGE
jgi:hypothetical protein